MKNFVNGYSKPRFKIYTQAGIFLETIDLDLCGVDGLVETYEIIYKEHNLLNYSTTKKYLGHHISFNLSYTQYSDIENTLKIKSLINHILNNNKIIIIPRVDVLGRYYEVNYTGDMIELGIMKGAENATGNRLLALQFKTKYLQSSLDWVDPNDLNIPIEDFITL